MRGLAYRMLGSISEAEDAVQEVGLRWLRTDPAEIDNTEAWLISVTTRLCVDRLRSLSAERSAYQGWWLPEPIVTPAGSQPDAALDLSADLSIAFLTVLERLSPDERAVFVLREVFDCPFASIATILGKTEASCRQLGRRARIRVRELRPRFEVSRDAHERLLGRFLTALQDGDQSELLSLLSDDATLASDGGGKVKVSKAGIFGADRITRLIVHGRLVPRQLRQSPDRVARRIVTINGEAGVITIVDGRLLSTLSISSDGTRIHQIHQVLNPDKLAHVTVPP